MPPTPSSFSSTKGPILRTLLDSVLIEHDQGFRTGVRQTLDREKTDGNSKARFLVSRLAGLVAMLSHLRAESLCPTPDEKDISPRRGRETRRSEKPRQTPRGRELQPQKSAPSEGREGKGGR